MFNYFVSFRKNSLILFFSVSTENYFFANTIGFSVEIKHPPAKSKLYFAILLNLYLKSVGYYDNLPDTLLSSSI